MSKKYNLKISEDLKRIFEVYIRMDPLKRYSTISQYLNSLVNTKANEVLESLKSELTKDNPDLKKILEEKEFENVLKAINSNVKY